MSSVITAQLSNSSISFFFSIYLFLCRQIFQEQVHHPFGCNERTDLVIQYLLLREVQHFFYRRIMVDVSRSVSLILSYIQYLACSLRL